MRARLIIVRKSRFLVELVSEDGLERFDAAIGANPDGRDKVAEGDCRTPEGVFAISSIEDSRGWEHEGREAYGPHFLRLSCPPWQGIGIHGTDEPALLGTRSSLGCVRMSNDDLEKLVGRVDVGTLVIIAP
jgi:lipoprotein-anchoring transpeptidase ErfK/SrfK